MSVKPPCFIARVVRDVDKYAADLRGAPGVVLGTLADFCNDDDLCWPGTRLIELSSGEAEGSVAKALRILKTRGLIQERKLEPVERRRANLPSAVRAYWLDRGRILQLPTLSQSRNLRGIDSGWSDRSRSMRGVESAVPEDNSAEPVATEPPIPQSACSQCRRTDPATSLQEGLSVIEGLPDQIRRPIRKKEEKAKKRSAPPPMDDPDLEVDVAIVLQALTAVAISFKRKPPTTGAKSLDRVRTMVDRLRPSVRAWCSVDALATKWAKSWYRGLQDDGQTITDRERAKRDECQWNLGLMLHVFPAPPDPFLPPPPSRPVPTDGHGRVIEPPTPPKTDAELNAADATGIASALKDPEFCVWRQLWPSPMPKPPTPPLHAEDIYARYCTRDWSEIDSAWGIDPERYVQRGLSGQQLIDAVQADIDRDIAAESVKREKYEADQATYGARLDAWKVAFEARVRASHVDDRRRRDHYRDAEYPAQKAVYDAAVAKLAPEIDRYERELAEYERCRKLRDAEGKASEPESQTASEPEVTCASPSVLAGVTDLLERLKRGPADLGAVKWSDDEVPF